MRIIDRARATVCILSFLLLSAVPAVRTAAAPQTVTGGAGWRTFDGKKYYYDQNGSLQKNKIIRSGKSAWYVDDTGALCTDGNIRRAVKFVVKYGWKKPTQQARLKACYKKLTAYDYSRYYKGRSAKPVRKNLPKFASAMFRRKKGYCYNYASAMCYIAKVLGYEARFVSGAVSKKAGSTAGAR